MNGSWKISSRTTKSWIIHKTQVQELQIYEWFMNYKFKNYTIMNDSWMIHETPVMNEIFMNQTEVFMNCSWISSSFMNISWTVHEFMNCFCRGCYLCGKIRTYYWPQICLRKEVWQTADYIYLENNTKVTLPFVVWRNIWAAWCFCTAWNWLKTWYWYMA